MQVGSHKNCKIFQPIGENTICGRLIGETGTRFVHYRVMDARELAGAFSCELFAVKDADLLVFVTPHQFVESICRRLIGKIRRDAEALSLIKGMEVKKDGPCMISNLISEMLGINCCVLMGANIANEVKNGYPMLSFSPNSPLNLDGCWRIDCSGEVL